MSDILRVGVISDTHGLVRPEAMEALQGVSHILHGGDIGKEAVIRQLETLAPVTAVRGNIDKAPWADAFPEVEAIELGGVWIYLLHNIDELDLDPQAGGFKVVITGHSHKPSLKVERGVMYLNPGSAGPRRFKLPIHLAILEIEEGEVRVEMKPLLA